MYKEKLCYLAGAMEYVHDEGINWRRQYQKEFEKYGVKCIVPNDEEKNIEDVNMKELKKEDIRKYQEIMRSFINMDLNFISKVDMVVVKWDGELTTGTIHEVGYAYQIGKPIYLVTSVNKQDIPGWFLSCFSEIFSSLDELLLFFENRKNVIFIVDIDGTVCNSIGRIKAVYEKLKTEHLYDEFESWWNRYTMKEFLKEENILKDEIVEGAEKILSLADKCNAQIVFLTGRSEYGRSPTRKWLTEKLGVPESVELIMRSDEAKGRASECKEQMFCELKNRYPSNSTYIFFEDDSETVTRYSKYGLVLKSPECWKCIGDNI